MRPAHQRQTVADSVRPVGRRTCLPVVDNEFVKHSLPVARYRVPVEWNLADIIVITCRQRITPLQFRGPLLGRRGASRRCVACRRAPKLADA